MFKTEFVKYYKEKLEPYGFVKVKGSQPYFVRVINDEILHVITYKTITSLKYGYKAFYMMCGVASIYKRAINFSVPINGNINWMMNAGWINEYRETEYPTIEIPRNFMTCYYNSENISSALDESFVGAKIMIEVMDKISNMDEFLELYLLKHIPRSISFTEWDNENASNDEEGLYYSRKEYSFDNIERVFNHRKERLMASEYSDQEKKELYEGMLDWENRLRVAYFAFINNQESYSEGMKLLQKHYNNNIAMMDKYGIRINKNNRALF